MDPMFIQRGKIKNLSALFCKNFYASMVLWLSYGFFHLCYTEILFMLCFQDGPLRVEASTTGAMSTISKIIRMVSLQSYP